MGSTIKKTLKIISLAIVFSIALGVIIISALLISFHLEKTPMVLKEEKQINTQKATDLSQISVIRELTEIDDFPEYKLIAFEHAANSKEQEYIIECEFQPELTENKYLELVNKCSGIYWNSNKDETIRFSRGWSKKKYMSIPTGMKEESSANIDLCRWRFWITYKKNRCRKPLSSDSLNHYLGVTLPDFTIVNFIAPDETTIKFNEPISEDAYKTLEANDWCQHKVDGDESVCFISKDSTYMEIDDQTLIATLRSMK